jgi:arsenate reductase
MVTIWHNPSCGTSRNTLALLRHAGIEPVVVEYLETPPSMQQMRELLGDMQLPVRAILREKEAAYQELGLADAKWSDEDLLGFLAKHPILMQRPIVQTPLGTKVCRPAEEVLEILPVDRIADFTKSDGTVVRDSGVRRPR